MNEKTVKVWIARDKDYILNLFLDKPTRRLELGYWHSAFGGKCLNPDSFPEVKWEDEKPTEVELTIKIIDNEYGTKH